MFEIGIAIALVVIAALLVSLFLKYKAGASERRMRAMMRRAGLDPEIARYGDHEAIISAVRRQCRRCQSEDLCERWLAGEVSGENEFCPNRQIFSYLETRVTTSPHQPEAIAH
jgi:hypothetical protein